MQRVVIIGGGIAGTSCAEYINAYSSSMDIEVLIIAASDVVKSAVTTKKITSIMKEMDVLESSLGSFEKQFHNVSVFTGSVTEVLADEKIVKTKDKSFKYDKLCICTGAIPNTIKMDNINDTTRSNIIYIRDTDTVKQLKEKLANARKMIVIGNGGIALELVYEVSNCDITWCIRHDYIGNTFLDKGAATFFLPSLHGNAKSSNGKSKKFEQTIFRRRMYEAEREFIQGDGKEFGVAGSALGPDWSSRQNLQGCKSTSSKINIRYNCEPKRIFSCHDQALKEKIYVELATGEVIGGDVVVCATGASPNLPFSILSKSQIKLSEDGGIFVDNNMRSNINDIYAAGDVCSPSFTETKHWFPMKLWTQGWQMGAYSGKCIVENFKNQDLLADICFELFTHATTFFGFKVCLLGCYNAQNLKADKCELLFRCTRGVEYIKIVLKDDRVQGAILIGETDLEETVENLILNQLNVGFIKDHLLDPNVDIEDYFD